MIRINTKTKRKVAGIVALLLAVAMILSSVSVIFIDGAVTEGTAQQTGGIIL